MSELLKEFYNSKDEKERKYLSEQLLTNYTEEIDVILHNILEHIELRNNAYLLNVLSKKKRVTDYLNKTFKKEHFDILMSDSDPKTRKNAYIFMGNYIDNQYVMDLIKALKNEQTNYCISSLILTLGNYKIKNISEILNQYLKYLEKKLANNEIEKTHYEEIVSSISKVIGKNSDLVKHEFVGLDREMVFFLTCMPSLVNASYYKIKEVFKDAKKYKDGVVVKCDNLDKLYSLRVFYDAFIVTNKHSELDKEHLKKNIIDFLKSDFLIKNHKGDYPFSYRIEFVSTKNKEEKAQMYAFINDSIASEFKDKYLNNPSNYEFEIRVVDTDEGYDVYYKLNTYKDTRYDYRVKDLPASINPTSAAIMLEEVKEYLKKGDSVLDPFCGTSTMLIERSYLSDATLTGIDISKKAIEYSHANASVAKKKIRLVTDNCLNAIGYYDEIISNMPYGNRVSTHKDNLILYKNFIRKISELLLDDGVAILLTSEISLIKKLLKENKKLKLMKEIFTETGGLNPHLFVIKKV